MYGEIVGQSRAIVAATTPSRARKMAAAGPNNDLAGRFHHVESRPFPVPAIARHVGLDGPRAGGAADVMFAEEVLHQRPSTYGRRRTGRVCAVAQTTAAPERNTGTLAPRFCPARKGEPALDGAGRRRKRGPSSW